MKKLLVILSLLAIHDSSLAQNKLINFVNPFIGTGGHGHTYPGATLPFGMVQLSPDNGTQGWDWCSGYHYSDSVIQGFSHTHLTGTGIGDHCDISVMPSVGHAPDTLPIISHYIHSQETATPGYYAVHLQDPDIWAELTASPRCGMHKYTFPASNDAMIRFDLGFAINWDSPTDCHFTQIDDSTFTGWRKSTGWAKEQWVYFAVKLSKAIQKLTLFADGKMMPGGDAQGKKVIACLGFPTKANERVTMKVGISFASVDGARQALNEISGWNFDLVKTQAEIIWERELGKVQIHSRSRQTMQTFYTALYHTYLAPVIFSDANGEYKNAKSQVEKSKTGLVLSVHSLWDTFRGANPLLTVTQTELVPNIINSFMAFYDQSGALPVWDLDFNETNTMTGYHSVPIIADAIMKNIRGFDWEMAYVAMRNSAMQNIRGTDAYRQFGYVPQDKYGHSVTVTLEYAYDDWCIAQVARKLKQYDDYDLFMKRAANYQFLFDRKTGFFRGRNSNGQWVEPFDPYYSDHGDNNMYIEGTAWQHTFFVPHDVRGYAKLLGGNDKLITKLDSLFSTTSAMHGDNISNDISGMIGQYAHGNEPSHHIAYMYAALGQQWKTAERVREIMALMYNTTPAGLTGNEDCGQMSAWYVWSALGMYPMNPASGEYVFGSPLMDDATIYLPNKKVFHIEVKENSSRNRYIQKITWNSIPYTESFFRHVDMLKGGNMEITMGSKPSRFGSEAGDWPSGMSR
ncbi:MAG: GH92 family glycosyl hydrolase [Chitinophagaceae bacterium]